MTPLEKAKLLNSRPKPCAECEKSERIGKALYCQVSGKLILPQFECIQCCRGKRVKELMKNDKQRMQKVL